MLQPVTAVPVQASAPPPTSVRNADLLSRATGGVNAESISILGGMGRAAWLRWQLAPDGSESTTARRHLGLLDSVAMDHLEFVAAYRSQSGSAARELVQRTLVLSIHSRWELRERMVDFWHDHFSVFQDSGRNARLAHRRYDREAIRAHAFGRFEDMLVATAKSTSMLIYLNGAENRAGAPNENYAREVMELHTLGVNGPYTEADVAELARCLTGWNYLGINHPTDPFGFEFRSIQHDDGAKTVLGVQIAPGGGVSDGETVLRFLAQHTDTVDFVCRKLVRRFVSETAPEAAVAMVRDAWIASDGNLAVVTAALFSDGVADIAQPWANRKVKRPLQFVSGLARGLGMTSPSAYRELVSRLDAMGQRPFDWPAPNGFPDSSAAWSGDLYSKWSFASRLLDGYQGGVPFDDAAVQGIRGATVDHVLAEHLNQVMAGGRMDPADVALIQRWIDARGTLQVRDVRDAMGLVASSPSYQLH